ncbi:AraC family transcriptional regulator [Paenibacillus alkalitolerans]|uniref:AraC family transcriptional regulator n=1 Tax=Paenibacillus alkalitolerans TaxID=2799335 RepID=UPI0018F6DEDD|nr:helix-turn-helix domain-containing protein [Paenibacillus alkalitolerans]
MRNKNPNLLKEHTAIVNRVIDYIDQHLESELSLELLASKVSVSPSYLHRMFAKVTGENLNPHIVRTRILRASHQLVYSPGVTITDIAHQCGFSSLSDFSRVFKKLAGSSPETFREKQKHINRKNCQIDSKEWESYFVQYPYNEGHNDRLANHRLRVSIREFPKKDIYYIRHHGKRHYALLDEDVQQSFGDLSNMAFRNGLWSSGTYLLGIPRYPLFDFPFFELGYDACVTAPKKVDVSEEIGFRTLPGGTYAVLRLEEDARFVEPFVRCMLNCWLPDSGYMYDSRSAMMISYNNPSIHPERKWVVDICLPIV